MSTLQVDRIIPYQSASVTIDGLSAPNLATTGSNTFVGNQNIQGTITASIQEGFALVGGVGNVSTLVATSSFGTGGDFATTGSNVFQGNQIISGALLQSSSVLNEITKVQIANSTKTFFGDANTLLSLVGDTAVSSDMYVDGGNFDTLNILITQNQGTQFRDFDGGGYPSWLRIPTNTGNNPSPIFTRGLEITGSVSISGSDTADLNVVGRQSITGPTTGQTPQLIISSSDFTNIIGRGSITISGSGAFTPGIAINSPSSSGNLSANGLTIVKTGAGGVGGAIDFGNYLAVSTGDASELTLAADAAEYTVIGNWTGPAICSNSPTDGYPAIIGFQNKSTWTDGRPTFLTPVDVSGSVNITDVLQLAGLDPLPAGGVGQLAVSSSGDLYYHNGVDWQLK